MNGSLFGLSKAVENFDYDEKRSDVLGNLEISEEDFVSEQDGLQMWFKLVVFVLKMI